MPQLFSRSSNFRVRATLVAVVVVPIIILGLAYAINDSSFVTRAGVPREQPVPFSHERHVAGLGLDCRYCHTSVETAKFAGLPPTKTCMTCHSQIGLTSPLLAPVRASYRNNTPLHWKRVDDLPDFVYFDHSIHVNRGIGCSTCHGRVDQMPLTRESQPLRMGWCLNCHRHPQDYLRPRSEVFNMKWEPPADQEQFGLALMKKNDVNSYTDCDTCHR